MSFWLDDDENDDPWKQQKPIGSDANCKVTASVPSQTPAYSSQSDLQQLFHCINCGSTESYYDDATGTDVCTSCFTQSQTAINASQAVEADWEDVVGLAARTAGGQLIQQKFRNGKRENISGRTRQPLEELDQSVPLPDTSACLKGMRCVLQKSVNIVVMDILPKLPSVLSSMKSCKTVEGNDDSDDSMEHERQRENLSSLGKDDNEDFLRRKLKCILATTKELWLSYLNAWAAAAEFYGSIYPDIRFSFRDNFLSRIHVSHIVRRFLPYQARKNLQNDKNDLAATPDLPVSNAASESAFATTQALRDEQDSLNGQPTFNDGDNIEDESLKETVNDIGYTAIYKMLRKHNAHQKKGYMEAALFIRPSMTMVAAILWLALTKNRDDLMDMSITCIDLCDWIASGKLPLLSAYHNLLSKSLRIQLEPIAGFFRLGHPINPYQLEAMANNLCVACRMLRQPIVHCQSNRQVNSNETNSPAIQSLENRSNHATKGTQRNKTKEAMAADTVQPAVIMKQGKVEDVRYWSVSNLPIIIARLVARAGLDQGVLDRTLQLAGIAVGKTEVNAPNCASNGTDTIAESTNVVRIPMLIPALQISRIEELLALIAIACQMDPQWRSWTYCLPKQEDASSSTIIPWNESEFRRLSNGPSFRNYLDVLKNNIFPMSDTKEASVLPKAYFDAAEALENITLQKQSHKKQPMNDPDWIVRPCRIVSGANVPMEMEMTEWTFQRPINGLALYPENRKRGPSSKPKASSSEASMDPRKQTARRTKKPRRFNKALDEMILLPFHDFYQADRAMNDWVPALGNTADLEELRLLHFLAYISHTDPGRIQQVMRRLLQPPKKK